MRKFLKTGTLILLLLLVFTSCSSNSMLLFKQELKEGLIDQGLYPAGY